MKDSTKEKWVAVLRGVAPTIATALGGPFAGMAVHAASQALFNKGDGTEEEMAQIITSGDPDVLYKLKEAEYHFKESMKKLQISEDALIYADKDSARKREMAVMDKTPMILGIGTVTSFFGYIVAITFVKEIPAGNDIIMLVLGYLSAATTAVLQYYLGSSKGSKEKTDSMDSLMKMIAEKKD